jgi:RNA polymerase sigma-70 factor (ECF subfamily)
MLYSDGGGKVHAAPRPLTDRRQIAKLLAVTFHKFYSRCESAATSVNNRPGRVFSFEGTVVSIITFAEAQESVETLYVVLNPDKLTRWSSASPGSIDEPADEPRFWRPS